MYDKLRLIEQTGSDRSVAWRREWPENEANREEMAKERERKSNEQRRQEEEDGCVLIIATSLAASWMKTTLQSLPGRS